jgi:hypothetical protein
MAVWFRTPAALKPYWLFLWKKPRAEARGSSLYLHLEDYMYHGRHKITQQLASVGKSVEENRWLWLCR